MSNQLDFPKLADHLFVALSIIIGLALTSALESWTQIIRNLANTEIYYLHVLYSFVAFVWAIQFWWGLWKYQDIQWSFPNFILFLTIAILVFLLNDLIYPQVVQGEPISLRQYYFEIRPWFFGALSLSLLLVTFRSVTLTKRPIVHRTNLGYLIALAFTFSLIFSNNMILHNLSVIGYLILLFHISKDWWDLNLKKG